MFEILEADIVVMQELKIQRKDLKDDMVLVPGWDCFFSLPKHKKGRNCDPYRENLPLTFTGYSGVGIYTRQSVFMPPIVALALALLTWIARFSMVSLVCPSSLACLASPRLASPRLAFIVI